MPRQWRARDHSWRYRHLVQKHGYCDVAHLKRRKKREEEKKEKKKRVNQPDSEAIMPEEYGEHCWMKWTEAGTLNLGLLVLEPLEEVSV